MRRRGKGEGSISRRANGYFQASYTGSDGKRYYLQARTRQEATEKLQAALRDKALGVFVAGNSQTLDTFLASWLRGSKGRLAPRTYERYSGQIRLNVVPYIGDVPIRKLTPQHLSDLYATLNLSPASIAHLHRVLRSALAEGMRWNLIARNPADAVRAPRAKPREMTILTPDEVRAFFAAAKGDEHECLYVLAVHTGLRLGELLGLRWRDVDLIAGWLEVSASLTRGGQRRPPKTSHSRRRVKLSDTAKKTLSAHRLRMAERLLPMRARAEGDTLVFVDPKGDPFNGAHITERALKPLLRREGLREIRFHDLRHAFASLMLSQGARVDLVSQMLGHSSAGLTLSIYAHLMPGDQESAVHRLDLLLAGAG